MKHIICLLLIFLMIFARSEKVDYTGYKVYKFIPETEDQLKQLSDLQENNHLLDFWNGVGNVNQTVNIMIPPNQDDMVRELSKSFKINVMIHNVQKLIDEEKVAQEGTKNINWTNYYSVNDIYTWLHERSKNSAAELINIGNSIENRDLLVMKITRGMDRPQIWIDATIHAREWITGAVCTYLVNELLNSEDPAVIALTYNFEWHILCISNPDGYQYTRDTNRMWNKNRNRFGNCFGVDLNKNFDYRWQSSDNPCSPTFAGTHPESEPEVKSITDYIRTLNRIVLYLSLHSYGQIIYISFGSGNTQDRYPPDFYELMKAGNNAANSIREKYGMRFLVGNTFDLLGQETFGSSMDWVVSKLFPTLKLAFTIELRDAGQNGFMLPADQIIPSSLEFMDGLYSLVKELQT